jgi:hypothetical protein
LATPLNIAWDKNIMTISFLKQEVLQLLDQLFEERQRQALNFARSLAPIGPVGIPGKELLRFAGILTGSEAQTLAQAIEE